MNQMSYQMKKWFTSLYLPADRVNCHQIARISVKNYSKVINHQRALNLQFSDWVIPDIIFITKVQKILMKNWVNWVPKESLKWVQEMINMMKNGKLNTMNGFQIQPMKPSYQPNLSKFPTLNFNFQQLKVLSQNLIQPSCPRAQKKSP